jgi:hypothetical protein
MLHKIIFTCFAYLSFLPQALAAAPGANTDPKIKLPTTEDFGLPTIVNPQTGLLELVGRLITFLAGTIATVSVLSLIYAGYIYAISGGTNTVETRSGDIQKAKKILNWVIIGLVVAALSWSIVNILLNLAPLSTTPPANPPVID